MVCARLHSSTFRGLVRSNFGSPEPARCLFRPNLPVCPPRVVVVRTLGASAGVGLCDPSSRPGFVAPGAPFFRVSLLK